MGQGPEQDGDSEKGADVHGSAAGPLCTVEG